MLRFHLRQGGPAATPPAPDPEAARAADAGGACRGICGAEWWVQVRRAVGGGGGAAAHRASLASGGALAPEASIAFHWDGDEARMRASQHVPPLLATVTYLGGAGAPTLVLPLAADARGAALPADARAGERGACPRRRAGRHDRRLSRCSWQSVRCQGRVCVWRQRGTHARRSRGLTRRARCVHRAMRLVLTRPARRCVHAPRAPPGR